MIAKYEKLTGDLEGEKEDLTQMEKEEIERIEQLIKEEENMELDADKVVNYLINLIAYLNEDDEYEGKDGKKVIKNGSKIGGFNIKDLLKTRFQKAGFTREAIGS